MAEQATQDPGRSWPELVGKKYEEAARIIKEQNPDLQVFKVPEGSMVTMDFRIDRVRVYVDEKDIVVSVPRTG